MKFTSSNNGPIMEKGTQLAIVSRVYMSTKEAPADEPYNDSFEQLVLVYENGQGQIITSWNATIGFERHPEHPTVKKTIKGREIDRDNYLLDENKNRVISEKRTEACMSRIEEMGFKCGIPEKTDFTEQDLLGKKVYVTVEIDSFNNKRMAYLTSVEEYERKAGAEIVTAETSEELGTEQTDSNVATPEQAKEAFA